MRQQGVQGVQPDGQDSSRVPRTHGTHEKFRHFSCTPCTHPTLSYRPLKNLKHQIKNESNVETTAGGCRRSEREGADELVQAISSRTGGHGSEDQDKGAAAKRSTLHRREILHRHQRVNCLIVLIMPYRALNDLNGKRPSKKWYLCIVGSDQADGPKEGATFLPERYYLSRSLQPPFSRLTHPNNV